MILELIDEAQASGARLKVSCQTVGLDERTIQRWRRRGGGDDLRAGPKSVPSNKISSSARKKVLEVANSEEFRNLSPKQIVPILADRKEYVASESTFYRVLREEKQMAHRGRAKPASRRAPAEKKSTGPNQVWSWDITYLKANVRGTFYYLYMFMDVWSRRIVGHAVFEEETEACSSSLLKQIMANNGDPEKIVLHSDNGGPMKGATMKATMEKLGVLSSYSRPRVSNDNPCSEALFRTLKYRPSYPSQPFESLEHASKWVDGFVRWYNEEHRHSAIGYVTPASRHDGSADEILRRRKATFEAAKRRYPERWGGRPVRRCEAPKVLFLNPSKATLRDIERQREKRAA